jgi:hypothetical protein
MTKCFPKKAESEMRMGSKRTIEFRVVLKRVAAVAGGGLVALPFYFLTHFTGMFAFGILLGVAFIFMAENYEPMEGESFFTWLKLFLKNQIKAPSKKETIPDLFIDLLEIRDPELGEVKIMSQSIEIAEGSDIALWRKW